MRMALWAVACGLLVAFASSMVYLYGQTVSGKEPATGDRYATERAQVSPRVALEANTTSRFYQRGGVVGSQVPATLSAGSPYARYAAPLNGALNNAARASIGVVVSGGKLHLVSRETEFDFDNPPLEDGSFFVACDECNVTTEGGSRRIAYSGVQSITLAPGIKAAASNASYADDVLVLEGSASEDAEIRREEGEHRIIICDAKITVNLKTWQIDAEEIGMVRLVPPPAVRDTALSAGEPE